MASPVDDMTVRASVNVGVLTRVKIKTEEVLLRFSSLVTYFPVDPNTIVEINVNKGGRVTGAVFH